MKKVSQKNSEEARLLSNLLVQDMGNLISPSTRVTIKMKYYFVMYQLTSFDRTFREAVLNKWNFSQISLEKYFDQLEDITIYDLSINLLFTQRFLDKVFDIDNKREYLLSLEFATLLSSAQKYFLAPPDDSLFLSKLRYVGMFTLKMIEKRAQNYKKLHSRILVPLATFFTEKSQVTRWNANSIKKSLYSILESTISFDFYLDQPILDLIFACNEEMIISKIPIAALSPSNSLWKNDMLRETIQLSLEKDLNQIGDCFSKNWTELGLSKLDSPQQKEQLNNVRLNCQRFVYSTLQDLQSFVLAFRASPKKE